MESREAFMDMSYHWYDFVGNIGIVLIIGAYAAIQMGKLSANEARYYVLNGSGAVLILISLIYKFNLSAFLIEVAWLVISIVGFVKARRKV